MSTATETIEEFVNKEYKYGFVTNVDTDKLPPGLSEDVVRLISLKKNVGYRVRLPPKGSGACYAVLPGLIKPDWMTTASCECQGVIEHNGALSPTGDSQILSPGRAT